MSPAQGQKPGSFFINYSYRIYQSHSDIVGERWKENVMSTKVFSAYKWRLHEDGSYSFKEGPGFEIYVDCFCTENKNPDCLRRHHRLNIQTDLDWYSVDLYCLVNQNQETKFYHRISEQMFR